jgi:hypothetical protein
MCLGNEHEITKTCTRVLDPERKGKMKKNLIALLVIALVSVGLFAVDPTAGFDVTASVGATNEIKVTKIAVTTAAAFDLATNAFGSSHTVTAGGPQTGLAAYVSTKSNNRGGYTISMSATSMKSGAQGETPAYINYTVSVTAGSEVSSITTTSGTTAASKTDFITVSSLNALTVQSYLIELSVNATEFTNAVEGEYSGNITFTFSAK